MIKIKNPRIIPVDFYAIKKQIAHGVYFFIKNKVKLYSGNDLVLWVGTKIGEVAK